MAVLIEMPKLSDTMEEGGIANWLKKEGEQVEVGEALVEIETDKATMEYESPEEGVLLKIIVPAGKKVGLNAPIAVIGEKGEDPASVMKSAPKPAATPKVETKEVARPATLVAPAQMETAGRVKASPLAKKIAHERGIALSGVQGSGPSGRVVLKDLDNVSVRAPAKAEDKLINVSMMRGTIAKRLLAAKNDAPHFYLTRSVNMAQIISWREMLNKDLKEGTPKISVNDILILLVAKALAKHPEINSSWQGEFIKQSGNINIAFAVALPTGLVTPVIKNADILPLREISAQAKSLGAQAKQGANLDYTSGTFTISNLGMMGIEDFTAIINPPQAAILAVGATIPTPWVNTVGQVVVEPRMKMTMSCDHRVIDGAMGAQFLQTLTSYLEQPLMILS